LSNENICFAYQYGRFLTTVGPCFSSEIQEDLHTKLTQAAAARSDGKRTENKFFVGILKHVNLNLE
jgi:hypothetical protein